MVGGAGGRVVRLGGDENGGTVQEGCDYVGREAERGEGREGRGGEGRKGTWQCQERVVCRLVLSPYTYTLCVITAEPVGW